ncbi:MAG: aminotransferase class I/II-fold pyridoxal phosphate-dependent enzyme [Actinomycetaceae bacterium]|nr:aminotransferase class I/II-fold pyridoxal phosphate-dependent enzyme [Actinomycetaceae bacterium]MDY6083596.1 aminotransferase class I/II-fold pyridoxal phosphate-dependent enzyme [Actinomycetaceae bacterium]
MTYKIAEKWQSISTFSLDVEALRHYDDVIDLSIGDTDFVTDPEVINAACADAHAGYTHYGFPQGDPELIDAIRAYWREDFGQEINPDNVYVTASSSLGMVMVLMALLNPGDEVIVFSPYFPVYRSQVMAAGGRIVDVPLSDSDGWAIHEDALEAAVSSRTRVIIFNNPCNPTGAVYAAEDYQAIANVALRHDLIVAADEIYTDYCFAPGVSFVPMRSLPGMAAQTVTLNSFSKNFLMTGWRVGYMIADKPLIDAVGRISDTLIYTAPSISQRAAIRALGVRERIRKEYTAEYGRRQALAIRKIHHIPYFDLVDPQGTFYMFPSIRRTGLTSADFVEFALRNAHVLLLAGDAFGIAGSGHVRIALNAQRPVIDEACDRLAAVAPQFTAGGADS